MEEESPRDYLPRLRILGVAVILATGLGLGIGLPALEASSDPSPPPPLPPWSPLGVPPSSPLPPPPPPSCGPAVGTLSSIIGWTYFAAWILSFFPQLVLNWQRKSVVGLSFDYQLFNFCGFACYSAFNLALFYAPSAIPLSCVWKACRKA